MPDAIRASELAEFQCLLIGSWSNDFDKLKNDPDIDKLLPKGTDGKRVPFSFNIMPLPQVQVQENRPSSQDEYGGFILKNFTFTETIRFNGAAKTDDGNHADPAALAVIAGAPNRGGDYTQFVHAVFYDQQVRFAEGPQGPDGALTSSDEKKKDLGDIVHVENGTWLHLETEEQVLGPYKLTQKSGLLPKGGSPFVEGTVLPQPPYVTIAKQIAVPHGNSVLALGNFDILGMKTVKNPNTGKPELKPNVKFPGAPAIPDAFVPYPEPADIIKGQHTNAYDREFDHQDDFENPNSKWTWNANEPLQLAVAGLNPTSFIHWRMTTLPLPGGTGSVTNIPFEQRKSKVTQYWADYWLLSTDPNFDPVHPEKNDDVPYDYLVYNQTILMEMDIYIGEPGGSVYDLNNFRRYVFPHVTSNTVKRIGTTPAEGRKGTGGCAGCADPEPKSKDGKAAAQPKGAKS